MAHSFFDSSVENGPLERSSKVRVIKCVIHGGSLREYIHLTMALYVAAPRDLDKP